MIDPKFPILMKLHLLKKLCNLEQLREGLTNPERLELGRRKLR
jgi:hypothetical protein